MTLLSSEEQSIAAGDRGDGAAMAMRIVAEAGRLMGAPRLIPVASAHIDGALYHGDSGTLFAEALVAGGARVAVPASLNVGALDLVGCSRVRLPPHERDMAKRMMVAYEAMGCAPTWTCAPYQAGHRPAAGTDVAWGESNAVVFCNSVLGARTNRYGDFLDIACAIVGRAPDYGLHRPENRRARFVVDAWGLSKELRGSDAFWPVLGTWYGLHAGTQVGVVDGLAGFATEDRLKAFGAASASAGGVGLFHMAGVTPEAPDVATAAGGSAEGLERTVLTGPMLREAYDRLSTAGDDAVDAVAIGSPHLSLDEARDLLRLLAGRAVRVPFYACTGRHVIRALEADGSRAALEALGITLVADTCVVVTPILERTQGVLMTNSGKFAHYAPGNTGLAARFGALADCVESAVAGPPRPRRKVVVMSADAGPSVAHGPALPFTAEVLIAGDAAAEGDVLALTRPISFWGGVHPRTGAIIDARHPQQGALIAGRVLALPGTIGSSSASAVLLELVHAGRAPAALLMTEPDAILLLGLVVARQMGWPVPTALRVPADVQSALADRRLRITQTASSRPLESERQETPPTLCRDSHLPRSPCEQSEDEEMRADARRPEHRKPRRQRQPSPRGPRTPASTPCAHA